MSRQWATSAGRRVEARGKRRITKTKSDPRARISAAPISGRWAKLRHRDRDQGQRDGQRQRHQEDPSLDQAFEEQQSVGLSSSEWRARGLM